MVEVIQEDLEMNGMKLEKDEILDEEDFTEYKVTINDIYYGREE